MQRERFVIIFLFFNLDNYELFLKGFSIRELLPKAHVDGVLRRAALVLPKLLEL